MSELRSACGGDAAERRLWHRLEAQRDQAARARLVELYMPLARRMASRYAGVSEP